MHSKCFLIVLLKCFHTQLLKSKLFILFDHHILYYTPGKYADRYIVFAFPFVCSLVSSFVNPERS